jgi:hypothetical protein
MPKSYAATIAALLLSLTACSDPCDSVAELTCKSTGPASQECLEMKNFAHEAGAQDQEVCKHLLETVNQLTPR